jgi:hypothetical protein
VTVEIVLLTVLVIFALVPASVVAVRKGFSARAGRLFDFAQLAGVVALGWFLIDPALREPGVERPDGIINFLFGGAALVIGCWVVALIGRRCRS